jgi:histidine phosphotransfer protein HptB
MTTPTIDPATFAELQANAGADFVAELVQTFAEEAPLLLAELRAALAAGGATGAAERFRRAAHSLKSNSNTFGATTLAELARTLELGGMPADTRPIDVLATEYERSLAALKQLAGAQAGGQEAPRGGPHG